MARTSLDVVLTPRYLVGLPRWQAQCDIRFHIRAFFAKGRESFPVRAMAALSRPSLLTR